MWVPLLKSETGRGVSLLNFDGGSRFPLLNFEGGFGSRVPRSQALGSWSHSYTMPFRKSHFAWMKSHLDMDVLL